MVPRPRSEGEQSNFRDLVWGRTDGRIELAIEAKIPEDRRKLLLLPEWRSERRHIRYEVSLGPAGDNGEVVILGENVFLKTSSENEAESARPT